MRVRAKKKKKKKKSEQGKNVGMPVGKCSIEEGLGMSGSPEVSLDLIKRKGCVRVADGLGRVEEKRRTADGLEIGRG